MATKTETVYVPVKDANGMTIRFEEKTVKAESTKHKRGLAGMATKPDYEIVE